MAKVELTKTASYNQSTAYSVTLGNADYAIIPVSDVEVAGITISAISAGAVETRVTTDTTLIAWSAVLLNDNNINPFTSVGATDSINVSPYSGLKITANGGTATVSILLKNE